jgi:hypothetical protein
MKWQTVKEKNHGGFKARRKKIHKATGIRKSGKLQREDHMAM